MAHFQRAMMMYVDQAAKATKDAEIEAEIEDFLEGFNQATLPRHAGQWGPGWQPGHPEMGGPGTAARMPSGSNRPLRRPYSG